MNWRDYLRADEVRRLASLKAQIAEIHAEQRRIYDRCRKRANRLEQSAEVQADVKAGA